MRRLALAGLLALLVAVVFAPAAVAQMNDDNMMMDDSMMSSASASPLPRTGGVPLMPLLSAAALALMAGSGMGGARDRE